MTSAISWIILSKHAVFRMMERKITLQDISDAASYGDVTESDQELGVFISSFNDTIIVFRQTKEDSEKMVILTCYPESLSKPPTKIRR
jgi:hypothetical protein